jgi:hypothetical protein
MSAAAAASAATATITGGPTVTGTASNTLFKFHTTAKAWSCTGATSNGTVVASATGTLPPGIRVGTVTPAFTGCGLAGGIGFTVACQPAAFTVNAITAAGSTKGSLAGISCHIFVTSQTACRYTLAGSLGITYTNGTSPTLVTDTNHQSLAVTNSTNGTGGACALLLNDPSVRFTSQTSGDQTYAITPSNLNINVTP